MSSLAAESAARKGQLLERPRELTEIDDMPRVEVSCHPQEPVKV